MAKRGFSDTNSTPRGQRAYTLQPRPPTGPPPEELLRDRKQPRRIGTSPPRPSMSSLGVKWMHKRNHKAAKRQASSFASASAGSVSLPSSVPSGAPDGDDFEQLRDRVAVLELPPSAHSGAPDGEELEQLRGRVAVLEAALSASSSAPQTSSSRPNPKPAPRRRRSPSTCSWTVNASSEASW